MRRTLAALGVAVLTTIGLSQVTYAADNGYDGIDMDCSYNDFDSLAEARAYWVADGGSINRNVDDMDRDRDGTACDAGLTGTPPSSGDDSDDSGDDDGSDDSGSDDGGDSSDDSGDDQSGDDTSDDSTDDTSDDSGSGSGNADTDEDHSDRVQSPADPSSDDTDDASDDTGGNSSGDGENTSNGSGSSNNGSGSAGTMTTLPSTGARQPHDTSVTFLTLTMLASAVAAGMAAMVIRKRVA